MSRPSWRITLAVWRALVLREAVTRMFSSRGALVWLLIEPASYIAFIALILGSVRAHVIGGMDSVLWLASGLLAFFLFRRTATQGSAAISANQALFTYRQVLPVDTVLARCILEGLLMTMVSFIIMAAVLLKGVRATLDDPLAAGLAYFGMWLFAVAWALVVSVASGLVPEFGNVVDMLMRPLMFASGAAAPLNVLPPSLQGTLMLNPLAHGIEGLRHAVSGYYHAPTGVSLSYLYGATLVLGLLGLMLQVRFRERLVAQ